MDLINKDDNCWRCEFPKKSLILLEGYRKDGHAKNFYICQECLIKAVLMVRPMPFGDDYIKSLLGQASRKRQGNINGEKIDAFIDWLKPFFGK